MGAFEYTALDAQGRERKGLIEGDTPKHVRQLLRDKQLLPMEIQESAQRELKRSRAARLSCARPVDPGSGAADPPARDAAALRTAARGVPAGRRGADREAARAADHPRRAQQSGRGPPAGGRLAGLPAGVSRKSIGRRCRPASSPASWITVLERLSDYTESRQVMGQQVSNAMVYPIVLMVLSFAIVSFLLAYVVPQVVAVFESGHQELPFATRILIGMSDLVRHYWFYAVIGIAVGIWGFCAGSGRRRRACASTVSCCACRWWAS